MKVFLNILVAAIFGIMGLLVYAPVVTGFINPCYAFLTTSFPAMPTEMTIMWRLGPYVFGWLIIYVVYLLAVHGIFGGDKGGKGIEGR